MQPVDVLVRVDRQQRSSSSMCVGERELDEEGVDLGVLVVLTDDGEQLVLGGRGRKLPPERGDADLARVLVLQADVDGAALVVADEDRPEPGRDAPVAADPSPARRGRATPLPRNALPSRSCAAQCRKCLSPVKTIARPSSSARAMISSSRTEPPGCTTTATPASAAASTPSAEGIEPVGGGRAAPRPAFGLLRRDLR